MISDSHTTCPPLSMVGTQDCLGLRFVKKSGLLSRLMLTTSMLHGGKNGRLIRYVKGTYPISQNVIFIQMMRHHQSGFKFQ